MCEFYVANGVRQGGALSPFPFNVYPNRPLRSANRVSLVLHRHRTVKLSRRLLDTAAATLWNDLPDNIRNCDNNWTFNKLLKTYLF